VNLSGKALAPVAAEDIMTTTISEQRDRTADYDMPADLHLVDSTRTLDGFAFQLRDTSGLVAVCDLRRIDGARVTINISVGMREHFDEERNAVIRAYALRHDFVSKGWIDTDASNDESA
jgi:hypothetical protein